MTLHAVAVPKWGLTMEEAKVASWLVPVGASVAPGEEIAEIETDKIANVIEVSAGGILRRQTAHPGDVKPVGSLLGVLADAAEDDAAIDAFVAEFEARFATARTHVVARPTAQTVTCAGHAARFLKQSCLGERLGAPIVLLHGFGGNLSNWTLNQEALAAGRDVYALDLPGHGGSSKDVGAGTLEVLAERTVAWLDVQGLAAVHLVGHSMGAAVAAAVALAYPGRVRSLVAICGAGFGGALNRAYLEGFLAAGRRKELDSVVRMLFENTELMTRQMLDDLLAYKRTDGVAAALRTLIDTALGKDSLDALRGRLVEVRAPLLAIRGAADRVVVGPATAGPAAQTQVIDGAGHMPQLEAAATVNAGITAFVRQHDG